MRHGPRRQLRVIVADRGPQLLPFVNRFEVYRLSVHHAPGLDFCRLGSKADKGKREKQDQWFHGPDNALASACGKRERLTYPLAFYRVTPAGFGWRVFCCPYFA